MQVIQLYHMRVLMNLNNPIIVETTKKPIYKKSQKILVKKRRCLSSMTFSFDS